MLLSQKKKTRKKKLDNDNTMFSFENVNDTIC